MWLSDYIAVHLCLVLIMNITFFSRESLQIDPECFEAEAKGVEGFSDEVSNLQKELAQFPSSDSNQEYPNIVFLGTGSCIPNKTRNTSAILLSIRL